MAQWKMLSDICKKDKKKGERLQQLYSTDNFPHKIRSTFAAWIESVDWDSLEKESNGQSGRIYFEHLISLIDDRCDSSEMDQILDLKRSKEQLIREFQNNYLPFIKVINNKLRQELVIIESSITDNSDPKRKLLRSNINNNNNNNNNNDNNSNNNEKEETMSRYLFTLNQLDSRQRAINFRINNCIVEQGVFIEHFDTKFEKYRALQETTSTKDTKESLKIEILRLINDFNSLRKEVAKEILELSNDLFLASRSVWNERSYWLIAQKKEIYSVTNGNLLNIDDLDTLFLKLNELIISWINSVENAYSQIFSIDLSKRKISNEHANDILTVVNKFNDDFLKYHIGQIFVVDKNINDRVLKVTAGKSCGFSMSVRLLGGLGLGLKYSSPAAYLALKHENELDLTDVTASTSAVNTTTTTTNATVKSGGSSSSGGGSSGYENSNSALGSHDNSSGVDSAPIQQQQQSSKTKCKLENGHKRSFTEVRGTNNFVANFHAVQLKDFKKFESKSSRSNESVTDQKYAFVFTTDIVVKNVNYHLTVVSLPIIITSQTSQEMMAKGTLVWDAAFSDDDRKYFEMPEKVKWSQFASVLNSLFLKYSERGLNEHHLFYLAKMAFNYKEAKRSTTTTTTTTTSSAAASEQLPMNYFDDRFISYGEIFKNKLHRKDYNIWMWIYACLNLVSSKLLVKNEWMKGYIYGFISKDDAKRKLENEPPGTFLLRFSETNIEMSQKSDKCGYLTLAVQELDPDTGVLKLFHVRDYLSPKEIQDKGLALILEAMEVADYGNPAKKNKLLKYLWPQKKRFEDVFGEELKSHDFASGGYRRGKFTIEIFLSDDANRRRHQESHSSSHMNDTAPNSVQSYLSAESPATSFDFSPSSCNNAIETLPGDFQLPLNDLSNSGSTLADDFANIVSGFGGFSDIVLDDTSYSGAVCSDHAATTSCGVVRPVATIQPASHLKQQQQHSSQQQQQQHYNQQQMIRQQQLLLQQHQLLTQQQQQLPTQQLQELLTQQQSFDNLDEFLLDGLTYDENGEIVFDTDNAEFD